MPCHCPPGQDNQILDIPYELAIAVAAGNFGVAWPEALATVIGLV